MIGTTAAEMAKIKRLEEEEAAEDSELIENLSRRYKESAGMISGSHADAHPFISAMAQFNSAIAVAAAIVISAPVFAATTTDPVGIRGVLLVMLWIISNVVVGLAHSARMEEMLMVVRTRSYGQTALLNPNMRTAVIIFTVFRFVSIVWWFLVVSGADISLTLELVVVGLNCGLLFGAYVFSKRTINCYIIDE